MRVVLQYFDGCPNWQTTRHDLAKLAREEFDIAVDYERIETHEQAVDRNFHGSPTVLIDGIDPFGDASAPPGLACRIYQTEQGPAGTPTVDQLRSALKRGEADRGPK